MKQTDLVDSDESGKDNENYDAESEEASEEEEEPSEEDPYEEEPIEEDPFEEEPNEEVSCEEEPEEDSCEEEPNEENLCEQEPNEAVSCEEELYEVDSCESPNEEACRGEPNEEPCEEEPYEDEQCEEEPTEEEPSEEPEDKPSEEEPSDGSAAHLSYNSNKDENSVRSNSGKKNISADTMSDPKRISGSSGIDLLGRSQNLSNDLIVPDKLDATGSSGKKRHSRWDAEAGANSLAEHGGDVTTKKRKTRWSNDDSQLNTAAPLKLPDVVIDLEIPKLYAQLLEITKKLQAREVVDDRPEGERSPSPPPIYGNLGIKINTREARLREKLMIQRQTIISELVQKNPNFKPPPDYKSPKYKSRKYKSRKYKSQKFYKKLYIPSKEYPGYNFVGLIIGPHGNTQKRMEKETGARILLRGRGSVLGEKGQQYKPDPSDNEDLHVLVEADSQASLDAAVGMVEKLLIPVEDGRNVLKLAQLRELAELKGSLREKNSRNFRKTDPCNVCGDASHPTSACPLTASTPGANTNGHHVNFLAEFGDNLSPFSGPPLPNPTIPSMADPASHSSKPKKEIDDTRLFVGNLPLSVNDNKLIELFLPFGQLCEAKVIMDRSTGLSKGFGFVKYTDRIHAAMAIAQMNGYKIDGKMLVVQIAGVRPSPVNTNTWSGGLLSLNQLPKYPVPAAIAQNNPGPMCWPGPPASMLPEPDASFLKSSSFSMHSSPFSGQPSVSHGPSYQSPVSSSLFSGDFAASNELAQFPGYLKSLDPPPQLYHQSTSEVHFTPSLGSHQMPPP